MRRRTLLSVGAATGLVLVSAGGALSLWQPARRDGRFTPAAQPMLAAVAAAVVGAMWPDAGPARTAAQRTHLENLEATIGGLPPALQAEVDELFTLLVHPVGRVALFGMAGPWERAAPRDVAEALQSLRTSSHAVRQQVFHALRDLNNAAWFAQPSSWAALGYPGPYPVGRA